MSRVFLNIHNVGELTPPEQGRWTSDGESGGFLEHFAAELSSGLEIRDASQIHSVPSVFARPLQFYQALEDGDHPLHAATVGQWRGLLAVFALHRWFNLRLSTHPFVISGTPGLQTALRAIQGDPKDLLPPDIRWQTILRAQVPRQRGLDGALSSADWSTCHLLYCDDQPGKHLIGATSPWTVVYTPSNYRPPSRIHWHDATTGQLTDPTAFFREHDDGHHAELAILYQWVNLLLTEWDDGERPGMRVERHWGFPSHLDRRMLLVQTLLRSWLAELREFEDDAFAFPQLGRSVVPAPYSRLLRGPIETFLPTHRHTDFRLRRTCGEGEVLALHARLGSTERVYRQVRGRDLDLEVMARQGQQGRGWRTRQGDSVEIPYLFPEEVFLPPYLMQIPLSSHALGYGDQRYAVPLTQEFFDYFDHRDLETRSGGMLEVLPGDDQVTVKLHLPVGDSEECTFMRVYRNEDIIRAEDIDPNGSEIPALGVWPDFCDAGWRGNFAIHAGPPHSKLRIQPLTLDRTEIPKTTRDDGNSQVWECSSPVLGFALFFEDDREKTVPIGMVLRKEANSAARLDQRLAWDVSLDFGTSNTHVCYRASGKAEIHELSLERRLLPLTKGSDALVREAAINLYPERGLRNAPIAVPLATVLNNREEITSFRDRQRGSPFFPCLEYEPYLNEYEVIDVKWSGSDAGIKEYLKGLVRHIAAEARKGGVATLNFHWSFPLSLPANQRRAMQAFWNTLRAEEIWGDLKLTVPQPGISESEATLRAIASHTPPILPVGTGRSLVIDVGGGSTDVAFWSPSGMEEQFSLKLGGSDLLNPLCTQEAVRDALIRACTGREPDDFIRSKFELRTAILTNYCLSHGTSSDGVRFGDMNPCSHPIPQHLFGASEDLAMDRGPWSVARTAIYLFFSGLSFYLGLCSREWIKKSKSEDGSQEGGFLSLYFGGRGSNLLAWLFNDSKYLRQVLKDAFMQGLTSEGHSAQSLEVGIQGPVFEFHRDLKPKTEVARGLLCPPVVKAFGMEDQLNEQTMPVEHGWKIDGDKQPLHWNHRLSRSDMAHLKAPSREDYSHTYIARFLEAVVPVHARALSLDEDLKGISPNWMAISEKVRQSVDERFPLQPLFIWELTSVIEAYLALRFGMVRGVGQ